MADEPIKKDPKMTPGRNDVSNKNSQFFLKREERVVNLSTLLGA